MIVTFSLAWWFAPYMRTLEFACQICGAEPDPEKLAEMAKRAIRIREVRK